MLDAEMINTVEDWVCRLERVASLIQESASQMRVAADDNNTAANNMKQAVREIPTYIRTGS